MSGRSSAATPLVTFVLLVFILAGCGGAPKAKAPAPPRPGATVRTSCPDRAPAFDDEPSRVASVTGKTIERVCVLGARDDDSRASIARVLGVKEGDTLDPGRVRDALEAVVKLGTTEDVAIAAEPRGAGVVLLVDVRERPRIVDVVYQGAAVFGDARLAEKGPLAKNTPLDRRVVDAVARAMRDEYASRGYGAAKVDFEIEPAGPGDVRVRFAVTEGPQWKLSKLAFPGAKKISEADLRKATELEEGAPVDLERVERAKFMLARAYHDRGMIMSRVREPRREVAGDGSTIISWTIDEGDVYRIGTIRFAKLGEKLQKELTAETKARPKETFNHAQLNDDLERIKAWFRARGQTVMAVLAIKADERKKTVDLEIEITEVR